MHGLGGAGGGGEHLDAQGLVHGRRGAFLDELLVLALHGAFALAEGDDVAVRIAQKLHFDVLDVFQQLFHIHRAVAKGAFGLGGGGEEGVFQFLGAVHAADAAAAAAGAGLDQKRIADLFRLGAQLFDIFHQVAAGHDGHARRAHGAPGLVLVAHAADDLRRGADELDVALRAELGKARVFRKQAVAGVDGLRAGERRGGEYGGHVQITARGAGRADADALVRQRHVQSVAVGLGKHRHGGDAHLLAGADDAHGDLAAVGDQQFGKQV